MNTNQAHLQQWFSEMIANTTVTRLDTLNLMQIARLSGLGEGELRLFILGQEELPPASLTNLITVVEGLGYKYS